MKKHVYLSLLIIILIIAGIFFSTRGGDEVANTTGNIVDSSKDGETKKTEEAQTFSEKREMTATIKTNFGEVTLDLFEDLAPNTVANFVKLANEGFYDGTKFHRVIKGFMIQGGDPLSADDSQSGLWGTGGPGYTFPDEIHAKNRNIVGTISMANSGPDTNGSQFFINVADNSSLDDKHTVFGRVALGMEVVDAIQNTQTEAGDRPIQPVIIEGIIITEK